MIPGLRLIPKLNPKKSGAQVTLELTISLIVAVILLIGTAKIFVWLNKTLVERQESYKAIRHLPYPSLPQQRPLNFYTPPKLDIFEEGD